VRLIQEEMILKLRNCLKILRLSPTNLSIPSSQIAISDFIIRRKMATATGLIDFIDASPTPFHMVEKAATMLTGAGFTKLDERQSWSGNIVAGGKYFYSRNKSTIVAFTVGSQYTPGGEFKVIGAHTDSPVLKLKPITKKSAHGYIQEESMERQLLISVTCYVPFFSKLILN